MQIVFWIICLIGLADCSGRHAPSPRRRRVADGIRFLSEPTGRRVELGSGSRLHCRVTSDRPPVNIEWFKNDDEPLGEGLSVVNGSLWVPKAERTHGGQYTCVATDALNRTLSAALVLDVVVSPRILEPANGQVIKTSPGTDLTIPCVAVGEPAPNTHWDRNYTVLAPNQDGVAAEGQEGWEQDSVILLQNGGLLVRNVSSALIGHWACTAGSAAGLARHEVTVTFGEGGGGGSWVGWACVLGAILYVVVAGALAAWCRSRPAASVGKPETQPLHNHTLQEVLEGNEMPSGGRFDKFSVPRTVLQDLTAIGRGEFGEVFLAKVDLKALRRAQRARSKSNRSLDRSGELSCEQSDNQDESSAKLYPVLVKALSTGDEIEREKWSEQLDVLASVKHENVPRLWAQCVEAEPVYMCLEYTDWGDLKQFLLATRTPAEVAEYGARVGSDAPEARPSASQCVPLTAQQEAALVHQLASGCSAIWSARKVHGDVAARNCAISSALRIKLGFAQLSRHPHSHEYYKRNSQVIPLRWWPREAVTEGDVSAKSDVYMFAATVWEIYSRGELPFAKLSDKTVLERINNGSLEWTPPARCPPRLVTLLERCWKNNPAERPNFDEVLNEVNDILKEITQN